MGGPGGAWGSDHLLLTPPGWQRPQEDPVQVLRFPSHLVVSRGSRLPWDPGVR